jgi:hypothetical protein
VRDELTENIACIWLSKTCDVRGSLLALCCFLTHEVKSTQRPHECVSAPTCGYTQLKQRCLQLAARSFELENGIFGAVKLRENVVDDALRQPRALAILGVEVAQRA